MSEANDTNPNRAPWSSPSSSTGADPAGSNAINPAPYASDQATARNDQPKKGGLGCWVWGCLGVIVFMLLAIVGIGFGTYYFVTNQVEKYTDAQAAELPVVEMEAEELEALEQRIETFTTQVRGKPNPEDDTLSAASEGETNDAETSDEVSAEPAPRELVLTATELNALIASKPDLRGRVFVEIQDGVVSGKVSVPTDGIPGGAGRFFNADAEFGVSMQDGILVVRLKDASVKGERIPQQFLDALSRENLAKDVYSDPDNAEMLRKFDSIEVVDDSIVLRLKDDLPEAPTASEQDIEASDPAGEPADIDAEPAAEQEQEPAELDTDPVAE